MNSGYIILIDNVIYIDHFWAENICDVLDMLAKYYVPVYFQNDALRSRPWYMKGGKMRPMVATRSESGRRIAQLWPEENPSSDRIVDQLMFIPPNGN